MEKKRDVREADGITPISVSKVQFEFKVQSREGAHKGWLPVGVRNLSHQCWLFRGSTCEHVPGVWMNTQQQGGEPQPLGSPRAEKNWSLRRPGEVHSRAGSPGLWAPHLPGEGDGPCRAFPLSLQEALLALRRLSLAVLTHWP